MSSGRMSALDEISFARVVLCVSVLTAVSFAVMQRLELAGLVVLLVLWVLSLPLCLGPLARTLRTELLGALCIFVAGASLGMLNEFLGTRFGIETYFLGGCFVYILRRRREARAVLRSPIVVALAVFALQQIWSGWVTGSSLLRHIVVERFFMMVLVVCTGVLMRRPGGRRLVPALLVFCTLMSLPVMLWELSSPFPGVSDVRAGGLYVQANVAGIMLSTGVACAGALYLEGVLSGRALAALSVSLFIGLFCTASRGGLINSLVALSVTWTATLCLRWGRRGVAVAVVGVAACVLALSAFSEQIARASDDLEQVGFSNAERLQEVVLALSGSTEATDDVMTHDSGRLGLVDEALKRIDKEPFFGYGTGNFMGSHVQFLEILGENGLVGAICYLALLLTVAAALAKMPLRERLCACILIGPWLVTHFHNHNVAGSGDLNLALAYVVGLVDAPAPLPNLRS